MTRLDRAILRESGRIRAVAQDCRSRIRRLARVAALIRSSLRGPPDRYGEARISGLDSGALAAFLAAVLLMVGAMSMAAIFAHVIAAVLP